MQVAFLQSSTKSTHVGHSGAAPERLVVIIYMIFPLSIWKASAWRASNMSITSTKLQTS